MSDLNQIREFLKAVRERNALAAGPRPDTNETPCPCAESTDDELDGIEYYMLLVEGGSAPKVKHYTLASATEEARRLQKLTGKNVELLKGVAVLMPEPEQEPEPEPETVSINRNQLDALHSILDGADEEFANAYHSLAIAEEKVAEAQHCLLKLRSKLNN
jgi:hypothetical protein